MNQVYLDTARLLTRVAPLVLVKGGAGTPRRGGAGDTGRRTLHSGHAWALKLNPPIDIAEVPRPGTVTAVASGTAAIVPLDWLEKINAAGIQPGQLGSLLDAMTRLAAEEAEITADMVSFRKDVTGLDNTVFISVKFPWHGPRIKVAIDPPPHLDPMGNNASVSIDDGSVVAGRLSAPELAQVRRFIDVNRDVLLDYWEKRIDADELRNRLRKV